MEPHLHEGNPPQPAPVGVAVVVLAAGQGSRMKSDLPKPLHLVGDRPLVSRVIDAGLGIDPARLIVVVSEHLRDLPAMLGMPGKFETAVQEIANGTGGAVRSALDKVGDCDWIVSLLGDNPLLTDEMIRELVKKAQAVQAKVGVLTTKAAREQYGRIQRNGEGNIECIVEWDSDDQELHSIVDIEELNSGIMVLNADWARRALVSLKPHPEKKNELLLTDMIEIAVGEHRPGEVWPVINVMVEPNVAVGVNSRDQLAKADAIVRARYRDALMRDPGVTMIGPDTIFISETVTIGHDTTVHPFSYITGNTAIGENCVIGPHAVIHNSAIADGAHVVSSTVTDSSVGPNSRVGPYAQLRQHAAIGPNVHLGNFVEVKNSEVGEDTKAGHLAYLGDASVGQRVNIGAGVITANYDGVNKHRTQIGDDAFIGSDTVLVAPRTVGDRGRTAAGSVVTHDVAPDTLVVGVPARPRPVNDSSKS